MAARIHIDPIAVTREGNRVTGNVLKKVVKETVVLSKRWPRAGNPAWTDSYGTLARHTVGQTYTSGSATPHAYIRNDLDYAMAVHQGTAPRDIESLTPRGMTFWWKRMGRVGLHFHVVRHPATKGSHFLTAPAAIVAKKYGVKFTTRILP